MNEPGVVAADRTLERLISRAAQRVFANGNLEAGPEQIEVTFKATEASLPEYFKLPRFADRHEYHARLRPMVEAEALSWKWDRQAGPETQLERLTLHNPVPVAKYLRIDLPWALAQSACAALTDAAGGEIPTVDEVLQAWRYGRSPAGVGAKDAQKFVDAARVILTARRSDIESRDILERRLSAKLFGNSKRIEQIQTAIAYLLGPEQADDGMSALAALGLVKHPAPILLAGPPEAELVVQSGQRAPLIAPYIGCSPHALSRVDAGGAPIATLLTIENLATFNEAAASNRGSHLLLMYVPGNPTPALLTAYRRLMESVRPQKLLHWGDIDVGGYRIASQLAKAASVEGHRLDLWRMNPALEAQQATRQAEPRELDLAVRICRDHGWQREADGLQAHPYFQEQETLEFSQPC